MNDLLIADYDYGLPDDRIAHFPLSVRDDSRLLVAKSGSIDDKTFRDLPDLLPAGATLVLNDTRVIEARLFFQKPTGGMIELFCLEPDTPADMTLALQSEGPVRWRCLIGGASKWKPGQVLQKTIPISGEDCLLEARFIAKEPEDFIVELRWPAGHHFAEILHAAGAIPLPPYIRRAAIEGDAERYQTVFGRHEGSVAAPTAALHFTPEVFEKLAARGIARQHVTLNVGAGTFKPVKSDTIGGHSMHGEHFTVTREALEAIAAATPLVAAGTTSLRTLESLYWLGVKSAAAGSLQTGLGQWEAYDLNGAMTYSESLQVLIRLLGTGAVLNGRTSLLIRPGYRFRSADALITNFHQPRSTLVLLVAAFIGEDWRTVYDHALNNGYRFLSYGDSSLLWKS